MKHSTTKQTTCFDEIHDATAHLCPQSLVIFDIDDVLITAKDHILKPPHRDAWLNTHIDEKFPPDVALDILGHTWTNYAFEATDSKVSLLNQSLKKRNIPSIALTAGWNGKLGNREFHCDDRVDILKSVHVDFSHSFDKVEETFFHGLENCGKVPSFKRGVIFACMLPKPLVLEAFLKVTAFTPKEIVFVDDIHDNIKQMQDFCTEQGIHYQGFHYTGVAARSNAPLDEELALFQFETVIRDKVWLSDEEARQKIGQNKQKKVG